MNVARFISFWTGFCSLSLEIAWVRLYGYANQSTPQAFAYVLAIYLLGIAMGAQVGKRICRSPDRSHIERASVWVLMLAAVIAVVSPWAFLHSKALALDSLVAPVCIFLTAGALSVLFPITHHLGTPAQMSANGGGKGVHFSRVYILNVIGAALGPLVSGYVLLEHLSITQIFSVLGMTVGLVAFAAWSMFGAFRHVGRKSFAGVLVGLAITLGFVRMAWGDPSALTVAFATVGQGKVVTVHENRHGIITIAKEPASKLRPFDDYVVYGGNVYDGRVNVSLERNTNGLERPLAMHVLQPNAKRVLVLGLSIGSWLTVVEGFPGVEAIDVVEINPGYLSLAKSFGPQKRALENPRVTVVTDDARRWLQYHPDRKYDLILMNTTWHWRANSSMLLSQEIMRLINRHLTERGVVAFNATGSIDAFNTASTVFKEVRRYQNFIYGANWDAFTPASSPVAWEVLWRVTIDGQPGFTENSEKITKYAAIPFVRLEEDVKKSVRPPEIITDDNMLVEYKYGRR